MKLQPELIIEIGDKIIRQKANSLLKSFFVMLACQMKQVYFPASIVATDGTTHDVYSHRCNFQIEGIRIGSGTTAVDICNDYALESELSNITYANLSISYSCDVSEANIQIYQEATNSDTVDKTVSEIGIYCKTAVNSVGSTVTCCMDRSLLVSPITLQPDQTMKITYKLKYVP